MDAGRSAAAGRRKLARQRDLRRSATACLVIVASALAMAGTAAASVDQVQINGAAPNSDGSGLQVSVNQDMSVLKVTNNSSSYTDIKEVDGRAKPTNQALSQVTTNPYASTCSVGANSTFSCTGLSVAPGDSQNIFLNNGQSYPFNGLATVDVIYDSIEVAGKPMDPTGKGLQVTAITKKGSCPDLASSSQWCLTVTSPSSNGTDMTALVATPNSPPADGSATQVSQAEAGFGFSFGFGSSFANGCGLQNGGFSCPAPFGVSPQEYGFNFSDSSFPGGLGDIQVSFQSTPCENTSQASLRSAFARAADAKCTPPSHTKITMAKINQKKHTALFKFKAKGTKKFICELTRNGSRLYYAPCHSPKPYASKLKAGAYVFRVDGTNQGGTDPHPAKRKFTLS